MKVEHTIENDKLWFSFTVESPTEPLPVIHPDTNKRYSFSNSKFFISAPSRVTKKLHPDTIALIAILTIDKYSCSISLDVGVSQEFSKAYTEVTGKTIGPIDYRLEPRIPRDGSRPALAYSGGVDSTAALYLMPTNTILYHVEWPSSDKVQYRSNAGIDSTRLLSDRGYEARIVKSDHIYVRDYPGSMDHWSTAVGPLVWSEEDNLDSIASANTFEAFYRLTYNRFSPLPSKSYSSYSPLFQAVGMPQFNVTAGVSEITTQRIVLEKGDEYVAQACVRSDALGDPCMKCIKCFRKVFLNAAIKGDRLSPEEEYGLFSQKEVFEALENYPMRYQTTYANIFHKYSLISAALITKMMRRKVCSSIGSSRFLDRWYGPSIKHIPIKYREETKKRILTEVRPMNLIDYFYLYRTRLSLYKYNPLILYWHHRFMKYYSSITKVYRLRIRLPNKTIRASKGSYPVRLQRRSGLLWVNVKSYDVSWGSSNGSVGYIKNDKFIVKKPGNITIRASYGNLSVTRKIVVLS